MGPIPPPQAEFWPDAGAFREARCDNFGRRAVEDPRKGELGLAPRAGRRIIGSGGRERPARSQDVKRGMGTTTLSEIEGIAVQLEGAAPDLVLRWALDTYQDRACVTSSFGADSACLLHLATRIRPETPVIFLDTGHHFAETRQYAADLRDLLRLDLRVYAATPEQAASIAAKLNDPDRVPGSCCEDVKVALMREALAGFDCWVAGLRREQSASRRGIGTVELHANGVVKVHPLASWSARQIHAYMKANSLPFHPLWYKGYTSIGCEPCTTPPLAGEGSRDGRWRGTGKTECGIHVFLPRK
jgi:phosphoadenosine phosphosulfate reductase